MRWFKNLFAVFLLIVFGSAWVEVGGRQVEPTYRPSVAYSRDGRFALSAPGGKWFYSGKWPDTAITFWDVERGKVLREIKVAGAVTTALALSADGQRGLASTITREGGEKPGLLLVDVKAGKEIKLPSPATLSILSVAISPDGQRGAAGDNNGKIYLLNLDQGKVAKTLQVGLSYNVNNLAYSGDGKLLLQGDGYNGLRLFNAESGEQIQSYAGNQGVGVMAISDDGRRVAKAGADKVVHVFEAVSGKPLKTLGKDSKARDVLGIGLSPDGKKALAVNVHLNQANKNLETFAQLWNIEDGRELWKVKVDLKGRTPVAFLPDGKGALLGGGANPFVLLDLAGGKVVRVGGG